MSNAKESLSDAFVAGLKAMYERGKTHGAELAVRQMLRVLSALGSKVTGASDDGSFASAIGELRGLGVSEDALALLESVWKGAKPT